MNWIDTSTNMKIVKASDRLPPDISGVNEVPPYVAFSFEHGIVRAASALNVKQLEGFAPGNIYWVSVEELLHEFRKQLDGAVSTVVTDKSDADKAYNAAATRILELEDKLFKIRSLAQP